MLQQKNILKNITRKNKKATLKKVTFNPFAPGPS